MRTARPTHRGIRFNLSLLLLMSTLNGIALAAVATVLFSAVAEPGIAPAWIEGVAPYVPWALAWVVAVALITIYEAYRLRATLSNPLERLTRAAAEVSAGRLDFEIPESRGAPEIAALGHSVRVMRDRLLESIARIDARKVEMETILANLGDGVLHIDAGGRIIERNAPAVALLRDVTGGTADIGVDLCTLLPELPIDWLAFDRHMQREVTVSHGGRERDLLVKGTPVAGANGLSFVLVVRDMTPAKEVDRLKRDFLSVVTHELKTPLTAIDGYTKLLLMGKAGPLSEKQTEFLRTVRGQTTKLTDMIQDLLDITRLEAGRLPMSLVHLRADEVLADAYGGQRGHAESRGLTFGVDASEVHGLQIVADPIRIQQVLGNLLGNAFKFTGAGGMVTLRGASDGEHVTFSVEDTGRGIPAEAVPRLFGKFYQVQHGDTRAVSGAGLGLYISRELVVAQGGNIEVTSTEGVGSSFSVRFPLAGRCEDSDTVDSLPPVRIEGRL